jgi:hypothetical protein
MSLLHVLKFHNSYLFNEFMCKLVFFFGMSGPD